MGWQEVTLAKIVDNTSIFRSEKLQLCRKKTLLSLTSRYSHNNSAQWGFKHLNFRIMDLSTVNLCVESSKFSIRESHKSTHHYTQFKCTRLLRGRIKWEKENETEHLGVLFFQGPLKN